MLKNKQQQKKKKLKKKQLKKFYRSTPLFANIPVIPVIANHKYDDEESSILL